MDNEQGLMRRLATRRRFLGLVATGAVGALIGCGSGDEGSGAAPTAAPTEAPEIGIYEPKELAGALKFSENVIMLPDPAGELTEDDARNIITLTCGSDILDIDAITTDFTTGEKLFYIVSEKACFENVHRWATVEPVEQPDMEILAGDGIKITANTIPSLNLGITNIVTRNCKIGSISIYERQSSADPLIAVVGTQNSAACATE